MYHASQLIVVLGAIAAAVPVFAATPQSLSLENDQAQMLFVTDAQQTGLDLVNDLSLEMWIKLESDPIGADAFQALSKRHSLGQRSYALEVRPMGHPHGKGIGFTTWFDGSTMGCDTHVNFNYALDTWYHLAAVKNATGVTIYLDGVAYPASQSCISASIHLGTAEFRIGADDDGGKFDGFIDDVRVWNVARSGADIAADMDNELIGDEPGLVGYWRFNGESLADATANGNDLTNVNGATFSMDVPFGGDQELTPEEQAAALIESVESYSFPKRVLQTYLAHLKKVPHFLAEGKTNEALDQLNAFVSKVRRHHAEGSISDDAAVDLLSRAEMLMAAVI